jgi:hypothetical protein
MTFERRDFLKLGTMGMATAMATPAFALDEDSPSKGKGTLEGACASVRLEGQLKAGRMIIEARAFEDGKDRTVITHSTLNNIDLYSGTFSYDHEKTVFVVVRDNDHSTSVLLSNTDDPKIGRAVVWNDSDAPGVFEFNKEKLLESGNLKDSIREGKGNALDVLGKRKPPAFTWRELEDVFGDDPALNDFTHGKRSRHHPAKTELQASFCHFAIMIPGYAGSVGWVVVTSY